VVAVAEALPEPVWPRAGSAWVRLGDLAGERGDFPEAESAYRVACEADPLDALAYQLHGEVLQKLGRREEGRRAKEMARLLPSGLVGRRAWLAGQYRLRGLE